MTTNKCNLKCSHCYQDAGAAKEQELTTAEGKKLIDEIARAGFKVMIFSGGEPLLRPDIYELVAYASSKGLRPVFGTNGMLITKEVAQKLKEILVALDTGTYIAPCKITVGQWLDTWSEEYLVVFFYHQLRNKFHSASCCL